MKAITLRNIPPEIQKAIRTKARQKGVSVNRAVIELLAERIGILHDRKRTLHHDLDELAGSWSPSEAKRFAESVEIARQIDEDLWR